jgi:hypothetical protein
MGKRNRILETSEPQICELIPGERILSRESIDRWKDSIVAGKFEEPTVTLALGGYYVTQDNHRIFATKEMGLLSVICQIVQVSRQRNVEAQDDTDCADALRAGLLGFVGLRSHRPPAGGKSLSRSEEKAIHAPSGDHEGRKSPPLPEVSGAAFRVATSRIQRFALPPARVETNTTRAPSGEKAP